MCGGTLRGDKDVVVMGSVVALSMRMVRRREVWGSTLGGVRDVVVVMKFFRRVDDA